MIRLRVRGNTGVATISIEPTSTLIQLKTVISEKLNIPSATQTLLSGFPPKQVIADDSELASDYFKSGDTVTLRQEQNAQKPAPPAASKSPLTSQPITPAPATSVASSSSAPAAQRNDSIASQGTFVIRVVPDDNSCLFRAVNGILGQPKSSALPLRQVVADAVGSNPMMYNSAFLGRSNDEYRAWILSDNAWGGAIELGILARHYGLEIGAFDLKTMRMDRYGEGNEYATVGYLIYDGIHYNYLALALGHDKTDSSLDVCQFDANDRVAQQKARDVCQIAHSAKQYTDTQNFKIKCDDCGTRLKGEVEVVKHANATGHGNFSEAR